MIVNEILQLVAYFDAGGLTAVIYTDALQTVIMVIGAFVLMFIGIHPLFKETDTRVILEKIL